MAKILLEMKNITKTFPGVKALDNVNLQVEEGEIHALVGENGAGKSTLMKILFGLIPITSGQIFLRGEEVHFASSSDAIAAGIGMVHQEFSLIPGFTATDNILLNREPKKKNIISDHGKEIHWIALRV